MARHFAYYIYIYIYMRVANENPAGQGCWISPSDRSSPAAAKNESLRPLTAAGDVDIWTHIIIFIYAAADIEEVSES